MTDFNKEVGLKIFNARKNLQMSRVDLGKKVNLHESTIKRYEDGHIKSLDIEKLKEFAYALNISPAYLMGWEENTEFKTDNVSTFTQEEILHIEDMRLLNDLGMRKVISYTKDLTEMPKYQKNINITQLKNSNHMNSDIKTIAAHNDHLTEHGEMDRIIKDIEDMDNW